MPVILQANGISKSYGDKMIIKDISLTLEEGELVCLLGVSGVGKTTLFNVLSGITRPDCGRILMDMKNSVNQDPVRDKKNSGAGESLQNTKNTHTGDTLQDITGKTGYMSYMLQKDLLLEHKKVIDNVSLPLTLKGMKKKEAREIAGLHFRQFGLEGTEYKYPSQLSGGMRQRAALLRTYLCGNRVALLDEPFSALDTITRTALQEWYLQVMEEIKLSTIFITHDIDEAILISDRIHIMKGSPAGLEGEIVIREKKPRKQDFVLTEEFLEYKRSIREML